MPSIEAGERYEKYVSNEGRHEGVEAGIRPMRREIMTLESIVFVSERPSASVCSRSLQNTLALVDKSAT